MKIELLPVNSNYPNLMNVTINVKINDTKRYQHGKGNIKQANT